MALTFYMDVHVPKAITAQLRLRGVKVITAQEDNADTLQDDGLLDRATFLGSVLVSFDDDLLAEAHRRQAEGVPSTSCCRTGSLHTKRWIDKRRA
jgi:hypothetical protein